MSSFPVSGCKPKAADKLMKHKAEDTKDLWRTTGGESYGLRRSYQVTTTSEEGMVHPMGVKTTGEENSAVAPYWSI